jgi:hypothetical protein
LEKGLVCFDPRSKDYTLTDSGEACRKRNRYHTAFALLELDVIAHVVELLTFDEGLELLECKKERQYRKYKNSFVNDNNYIQTALRNCARASLMVEIGVLESVLSMLRYEQRFSRKTVIDTRRG